MLQEFRKKVIKTKKRNIHGINRRQMDRKRNPGLMYCVVWTRERQKEGMTDGWIDEWQRLPVHLSFCLSINPSVHPPVCLSLPPSVYLSVHLSTHKSFSPSIHLFVCLSIHHSSHLALTDRGMDRQADGWTDKQTNGQTDRQRDGQTSRRTDIGVDRQTYRKTDRQTDRLRYRQTFRQTDGWTDTDWQTEDPAIRRSVSLYKPYANYGISMVTGPRLRRSNLHVE